MKNLSLVAILILSAGMAGCYKTQEAVKKTPAHAVAKNAPAPVAAPIKTPVAIPLIKATPPAEKVTTESEQKQLIPKTAYVEKLLNIRKLPKIGNNPATSPNEQPLAIVVPDANYKEIKAELAATREITIPGSPGDLKVWVGDKSHAANFPVDMQQATSVIQTTITPQSVLITPDAPVFDVKPDHECVVYDQTGTTSTFQITPKHEKEGAFRVGASVGLYGQADCKGTPVNKDPSSIYVNVTVKFINWDDIINKIRENTSDVIGGLIGAIAFILLGVIGYLKVKALRKLDQES